MTDFIRFLTLAVMIAAPIPWMLTAHGEHGWRKKLYPIPVIIMAFFEIVFRIAVMWLYPAGIVTVQQLNFLSLVEKLWAGWNCLYIGLIMYFNIRRGRSYGD